MKAWGIYWDNDDEYKLYTNNCSQTVTEILKEGGISISGVSDLIPNNIYGGFAEVADSKGWKVGTIKHNK